MGDNIPEKSHTSCCGGRPISINGNPVFYSSWTQTFPNICIFIICGAGSQVTQTITHARKSRSSIMMISALFLNEALSYATFSFWWETQRVLKDWSIHHQASNCQIYFRPLLLAALLRPQDPILRFVCTTSSDYWVIITMKKLALARGHLILLEHRRRKIIEI